MTVDAIYAGRVQHQNTKGYSGMSSAKGEEVVRIVVAIGHHF